jgi:hypothetical protein
MATNTKISNLINSQVPFFVRNDHGTFVSFIEAYFEYLEQDTKTVERIKNTRDYFDIDKTLDEFTEKLYATFLAEFPLDTTVDKNFVLKHSKDLYRSKGTEKSIRFLMRALYSEEIEFYYPKTDILRSSDGKWYVQKSLRVANTEIEGTSNTEYSALEKFVDRRITGNTSNASADVEKVERFFESGTQINELTVTNFKGTFTEGETIRALYDESGTDQLVTANVFGGIINSVVINDPGSGYDIGDPVIMTSTSGAGACAVIARVSSGNLATITVITGGAGYQNNDYLLISPTGGGSGANGNVSGVLDNSTVHPNTYNIIYNTISLEQDTAIGNAVYANLDGSISDPANTAWWSNSMNTYVYGNTGPVNLVSIADAGSGYTSLPTVSVLANSAIRSLGILGRMNVVSGGLNYVSNDKIEFINILGGYGTGGYANVLTVNANGGILTVGFEQMPGANGIDGSYYVGGSGYDQNFLPTVNVRSDTGGSTANVIVENLLGYGATFSIANTTLGAIERITIINRGTGYTSDPTVDMTGDGDGTANLEISTIQGVYSYPGYYLNDDGHLSSSNYIQDRDYYQNHSYVVKIRKSLESYRKALLDLVHPGGMKLFGEHLYYNTNDNMTAVVSPSESQRMTIKANNTYVKLGNTINISYAAHALANNTNVYLEFTDANTNINVKNGIFSVSSNTLVNNFEVIQYSPLATITINNNGDLYTTNNWIIFANEGSGTGANASYNINATGSIVSTNVHDFGIHYSTAPKANANGSNSVAATFDVTIAYANDCNGFVNVGIYIV